GVGPLRLGVAQLAHQLARPGARNARLPPDCHRTCEKPTSDGEPEVDDVAVPHHVVLALETELPGFAALHLAPVAGEVLPSDDLGADEAALDVAVDLAGRLDGGGAAPDRPGATLVLARGQEAHQVEEGVARADEAVPRARFEPEVGEESAPVSGLELRELR